MVTAFALPYLCHACGCSFYGDHSQLYRYSSACVKVSRCWSLINSVQVSSGAARGSSLISMKNLEVGHGGVRDADCKIASLAAVQSSRGSARALVTRGGSCRLFVRSAHCCVHWHVKENVSWPCHQMLCVPHFLSSFHGIKYIYIYIFTNLSLEGCLTPNFTSEMCDFWFHLLSLTLCINWNHPSASAEHGFLYRAMPWTPAILMLRFWSAYYFKPKCTLL